jgi:hypothetical protein
MEHRETLPYNGSLLFREPDDPLFTPVDHPALTRAALQSVVTGAVKWANEFFIFLDISGGLG